jgi:chromosome segregation ATPase
MADIEQTTEERISALEREVIELKQLLAEKRPIDDLRAEIARVSRLVAEFSAREEAHEDYMHARLSVIEADLSSLASDVKKLQTDVKELQIGQQELREEMRNGFQDLHLAYQELAAGQHHILEFLMGKSKMND